MIPLIHCDVSDDPQLGIPVLDAVLVVPWTLRLGSLGQERRKQLLLD